MKNDISFKSIETGISFCEQLCDLGYHITFAIIDFHLEINFIDSNDVKNLNKKTYDIFNSDELESDVKLAFANSRSKND